MARHGRAFPSHVVTQHGPPYASYEYAMSGGVSFTGAAAVLSRGWVFLPSGGVTFSGEATIRANPLVKYVPSGGITFAGGATIFRGWEFMPAGGAVFGGAATVSRGWMFTPSGGVVFSGSAPAIGDALVDRRGPSGGVAYGYGLFY